VCAWAAAPIALRASWMGSLVYRLRYRGLPGGAYEPLERTGLRETPQNPQNPTRSGPMDITQKAVERIFPSDGTVLGVLALLAGIATR
jgi:hypothetical protein